MDVKGKWLYMVLHVSRQPRDGTDLQVQDQIEHYPTSPVMKITAMVTGATYLMRK